MASGKGMGLIVAIATILSVPIAIFGIWVQHRDATVDLATSAGSPTNQPLVPSIHTAPSRAVTSPPTTGSTQSKGRVLQIQRSATFTHFRVLLRQVRSDDDVKILVQVCVRTLSPDPQGNRTRISWDPWSVSTGSTSIDAGRSSAPLTGSLPPSATYRVGQCAAGWIPFPTRAWPTRITYKNGVGDVATWDTKHPSDAPHTS